jgi:4-hydroxy-2-oxoheptanedioate aldolase
MKNIPIEMKNGHALLGTFSVSGSPTLVEMVGYAGFDFVIIDCEHAATSPLGSELEGLVRAAYAADIAPIVRVTKNDPSQILKALNFGAQAVIVPHVNTAAEARLAVQAGKYAPLGRRSCAPPVRGARHGFVPWSEYYRRQLEDTLIIPLLEEEEAIRNAAEIADVEGIGALFFGPFDLAVARGRPDDVTDPGAVQAEREHVYGIARSRGLPIADLAWSADAAVPMLQLGAQLVAMGTDLTMFGGACRQTIADLTRARSSAGNLHEAPHSGPNLTRGALGTAPAHAVEELRRRRHG